MPAPSAHISFDRLAFHVPDGTPVFTGLTAAVPRGRIGLVGANGVGKTTLLRIIAGEIEPSEGRVTVNGSVGWLRQRPDQPAGGTLSGGELTRLHLDRLTAAHHDLLLLDEPTNNLDASARENLYRFVEQSSTGLLVVSHDRELLRRMDVIVEMFRDALDVYGGNWDLYREQRAVHTAALDRRIVSKEQELERADRTARLMAERNDKRARVGKKHGIKANLPAIVLGAMKNASEVSRGRSLGVQEKLRAKLDGDLRDLRAKRRPENTIHLDLPATRVPNGKTVLNARRVTFRWQPDRPLITDRDLTLIGPRRVALRGGNGSGKTTLVRLILGELRPQSGSLELGVPSVGYLDQTTGRLPDDMTLLDLLRSSNPGMPETDARTHLARLRFRRDDAHKRIGVLSGGERMRAALTREFLQPRPPQLLILDEPTNNLDLDSIEQLESALSCYEGALLVISHDEDFLRNVGITDAVNL